MVARAKFQLCCFVDTLILFHASALWQGKHSKLDQSSANLGTLRLRPTGAFPLKPDRAVTFTFAPTAETPGEKLAKFRVWVWDSQGGVVVNSGLIRSGTPKTELMLEPGRFVWGVQWWSSSGQEGPEAKSTVVIGLRHEDWHGVPWIGGGVGGGLFGLSKQPCNEFQTRVNGLRGQVELVIAALGFGFVTVNGKPVSEDLLSPSGWTNTEKRVLFRSYDITPFLNETGGGNIFVGLGSGYRADPYHLLPGYNEAENRAAASGHDQHTLIFRLQILANGQRALHSGSKGWRKRVGAISSDSVYRGVREEMRPGSTWKGVLKSDMRSGPHGKMVPASFPAVHVTRVDDPVSIWRPNKQVHVVDFGSNVAGVCQVTVPERDIVAEGLVQERPWLARNYKKQVSNQTVGLQQLPLWSTREIANRPLEELLPRDITLRYGEVLQHSSLVGVKDPNPQRVYFDNLRSAEQQDVIQLSNGGVKNWWPRFTYHGFRYVEVNGHPNLTTSAIQRLVFHSDVEPKARAIFSDEVLQQIHRGSVGSQRSNLMQVPTDCPQRDERLGWLGDAAVSVDSMMWHFDYAPMASAFVDSMVDALGDDGSLPEVVPNQKFGNRPADPTWSAAFLEYLWVLWQDGNLAPAQEHWESVKKHVLHLEAQVAAANGKVYLIQESYGDWCAPPAAPGQKCELSHRCLGTAGEKPSKGFVAAFSVIRTVQQALDLGIAIGVPAHEDVGHYRNLTQIWREQFHTHFFRRVTNSYDTGVMVTFVLPLALGVTPPEHQTAVVQNLLAYIRNHGNTWTGGFTNNRYLFDVLHDNGHEDVALAILRRRDYPSYGYMFFNDLEPARESMWEVPDAPFQGPLMNSRNHHAFSSVGKYLLEKVAGLSVRGAEVTAVAGAYNGRSNVTVELARGTVSLAWERAAHVSADVLVPVGMTASVHIPVLGAGPVALLDKEGIAMVLNASTPRGLVAVGEVQKHRHIHHQVQLLSGRYHVVARPDSTLQIF